jgi:hypothetical protein
MAEGIPTHSREAADGGVLCQDASRVCRQQFAEVRRRGRAPRLVRQPGTRLGDERRHAAARLELAQGSAAEGPHAGGGGLGVEEFWGVVRARVRGAQGMHGGPGPQGATGCVSVLWSGCADQSDRCRGRRSRADPSRHPGRRLRARVALVGAGIPPPLLPTSLCPLPPLSAPKIRPLVLYIKI